MNNDITAIHQQSNGDPLLGRDPRLRSIALVQYSRDLLSYIVYTYTL